MNILHDLGHRILSALMKFLLLYFGLCLIWIFLNGSTKPPTVSILKYGIETIRFIIDFAQSISGPVTHSLGKGFKKILTHWGIKSTVDLVFFWLFLLIRIGLVIGLIMFTSKMVIHGSSNARLNHPTIFWILLLIIFISIGIYSAPKIAGTFHMSRVRASSLPWVEFRIFYVLLDAFLRFVMGLYLISLLCLLPHEPQEPK